MDAAPGTKIGTFQGRLANSKIDIVPGDGSFLPSVNGADLILGFIPPKSGGTTLRCTETPADGSPARTTNVTVTLAAKGAPAPLAPTAASQPIAAIYSVKKVVPGYAGAALRVRDSNGAGPYTVNFRADGELDAAGLATAGNGINFTVVDLYDQSGNGRHFSSTSRPHLVFPNAPTNYEGGYLDYTVRTDNMVTGATFLNLGPDANLTVVIVAGTFRWSSGGTHARNPAVFSNANGPILGYGTTIN